MGFCPKCGRQVSTQGRFCPGCGAPVAAGPAAAPAQPAQEAQHLGDNAGMRFVLPIGCSGWTIAAGYCGLLSFIPLVGLLLAVLSIVFGIIGLVSVSRNPHKHGIARVVIGWVFAIPSVIIHLIVLLSC